jgi:hypothetical protein
MRCECVYSRVRLCTTISSTCSVSPSLSPFVMHATLASGVCSSGCVARTPRHHGRGNALQHRGTGAEGRSADLGGAKRGRALLDALLQ